MCTYQGRIPNEDQILCKNMVVYLKIYKCYNAELNKHHKKMSSTIKFNPIILMCVSRQTRFWLILLNVVSGCPYSRYIRYTFLSNHKVNKRLCVLPFGEGGFSSMYFCKRNRLKNPISKTKAKKIVN